ncbi:MAG: DUF1294 domain-containing protein [Glaciecola sp.]|jgi:uncharacterized membrane protein YsdA (DUF1294 family)
MKHKRNTSVSVYFALLFSSGMLVAFYLQHFPRILFYLYIALSSLSFTLYAYDKWQAKRGGWRTQESTLHLFALLGGWPGAAMARQYLRHKSSKPSFRTKYWFSILINVSALFWLYTPSGAKYLKQLSSIM